ncbi:MAG TPA: RidA family protein [Candidatus Nitrosotalea sp.]|nr:RidA family protein [Candidatus Nitrosotalea sp.]
MIEEKIASLRISLPIPPKPAGSYIPAVRTGNLVFVSGQIPIKDGKVEFQGKVPSDVPVEVAQNAARLCIINVLAQLKAEIGTLDKVVKIVRVSGFVNSTPDFADQPRIINAASDLLFEIFGESGKHARVAVGVASLPLNSTVEIDLVAEVSQA